MRTMMQRRRRHECDPSATHLTAVWDKFSTANDTIASAESPLTRANLTQLKTSWGAGLSIVALSCDDSAAASATASAASPVHAWLITTDELLSLGRTHAPAHFENGIHAAQMTRQMMRVTTWPQHTGILTACCENLLRCFAMLLLCASTTGCCAVLPYWSWAVAAAAGQPTDRPTDQTWFFLHSVRRHIVWVRVKLSSCYNILYH